MVRLNHPVDVTSLNIVPWYIIGHAAYANSMMNRFPDDHPMHAKHKGYFEALRKLSEELVPPSETEGGAYHAGHAKGR